MHFVMWAALAMVLWIGLAVVAAPLLGSALRAGREPYQARVRIEREVELHHV